MNEQVQSAYVATQIFLDEAELAKRWKLSPRGLQAKRLHNPESVPPFFKLSKSGVRYPLEGILAFEQSRTENSRA